MVLSVSSTVHLDPVREVRFFKPISVPAEQLPPAYRQQLSADTQFYSQCLCGDKLLLQTNTCVRINTVTKAAPRSVIVAAAQHARILFLYTDPHRAERQQRAIVEYFVRPDSIGDELSRHVLPDVDDDRELILDHRKGSAAVSDISVLAAFAPFAVHFGTEAQSAAAMFGGTVAAAAVASGVATAALTDKYVCRYKIIKLNGKYCLFPWAVSATATMIDAGDAQAAAPKALDTAAAALLLANNNNNHIIHDKENTPHKRATGNVRSPKRKASSSASTTTHATTVALSVTPIKIVNNSVQKVQPTGRARVAHTPSTADIVEHHRGYSDGESDDEALTPRKRRRNRTVVNQNQSNAKHNACKNLNQSLGGDYDFDDQLNYSIEQQDALKVKIRISDRSKREANVLAAAATTDTPSRRTRRQTQTVIAADLPTGQQRSDAVPGTPQRAQHTPRKSILKTTANLKNADTPKRNVVVTDTVQEKLIRTAIVARRTTRVSSVSTVTSYDDDEDEQDDDDDADFTPATPSRTPSKRRNTTAKTAPATPRSTAKSKPQHRSHTEAIDSTPAKVLKRIRDGKIAPGLQQRTQRIDVGRPAHRADIQMVKESLHVSAVPQSLPCRETEFNNIAAFVERKIRDRCGGCMYVSGVPGTGKTATVTEVIRTLRERVRRRELPDFEYVAINGMKMTEPRQAYVEINRQLTGEKLSCEQAQKQLEARFTLQAKGGGQAKSTVLLVDELDILCNRRQDVVYSILDWPTKMAARLVVVTIANTMDLPERLLMGKVTSRLGLTRLTFQPYSHKQLQEVVQARLAGTQMFRGDAVQLVARKVASVSGDCRRALDICRRSIEIAEAAARTDTDGDGDDVQVSMVHVQQAFGEMISSTKVQAIKACSRMEQVFLQAVEAEVTRTGVEETAFLGVYTQFESILLQLGLAVPAPGRAMLLSSRLGASKLIIAESSRHDINQKILLNVSADDIHYALHAKL